ncbi:LPS export ABC transporter ATP-binding protein, partial [Desulfobacterales bacterium HSG16]|nr:LPS export ABC transporter ATP-binding protein [Desulfobacterales bacterium HSG16]
FPESIFDDSDSSSTVLDRYPFLSRLPMYLRARKGVGYLPQKNSVFGKLSVKQNMMLILEVMGMTRQEREKKSKNLLEELGINHLADQRAGVLSGGEMRRLEISRALATNPAFILLDEPFAGVDPLAVTDIRNIIFHLKNRNIGILISDHSVRETLGACDNAYILEDGKMIEYGTPEKIASSPTARKAYLGEDFRL